MASVIPVMASLAPCFEVIILTVLRCVIQVRNRENDPDGIIFIRQAYLPGMPVDVGIVDGSAVFTSTFRSLFPDPL